MGEAQGLRPRENNMCCSTWRGPDPTFSLSTTFLPWRNSPTLTPMGMPARRGSEPAPSLAMCASSSRACTGGGQHGDAWRIISGYVRIQLPRLERDSKKGQRATPWTCMTGASSPAAHA